MFEWWHHTKTDSDLDLRSKPGKDSVLMPKPKDLVNSIICCLIFYVLSVLQGEHSGRVFLVGPNHYPLFLYFYFISKGVISGC